jgi:TetR/AcrR family tetracycline transcriptional repressor
MALDRARILAAALALLSQDGLEGLTMRRLAASLGVKAASLYWHYAGKQALVEDMAASILSGVQAAAPASSHRDAVLAITIDLRRALLAHRDGALLLVGGIHAHPQGLRIAEAIIGSLMQAGFGSEPAGRACLALLSYVQGYVLAEQATGAGTRPLAKVLHDLSLTTAARYPMATAALADFVESPPDERFAFGVDLILGGLDPDRHDNAVDRMVATFRSLR